MSTAKVFAIALYDNEAESDDELTFKKNDLLQVLECDYMGMEGWWLCKLIKANKMGLAAGNRLKVTNDEKLIARLSNVGKLSSNKLVFGAGNASILSNSSSVSSILSSSSSSLSTTSGPTITTKVLIKQQAVSDLPTKLQSMSIEEHEQSVPSSPAKMPLPMKLPKKQGIKLTLSSDLPPVINEINVNNNNNNNNDDDDYDYDIPENNRPVALSSLSTSNNSNSRVIAKSVNANLLPPGVVRKSISPTIDSGVSTSSLASLNSSDLPISSSSSTSPSSSISPSSECPTNGSIIPNNGSMDMTSNHRLSSESSASSSSSSAASSSTSATRPNTSFTNTINHLLHTCSQLSNGGGLITQSTILTAKEKLTALGSQLHSLLANDMRSLKQDHACFHPDLSVFNRFKALYRHLKEFYFFYETSMTSLEKVYAWNYELITSQNTNEYFELVNRLSDLGDLLRQLRTLVNEKCLFEYNSESASSSILATTNPSNTESIPETEPEDPYQYDYDNNQPTVAESSTATVDIADYCTIDEDEDSEVNSATLKKSSENSNTNKQHFQSTIRREVRLEEQLEEVTTSSTTSLTAAPIRLTSCDQMLIKFYLKHIEENLNDLTSAQHSIIEKLDDTSSSSNGMVELAHKLAISGHKLVFICDTLQRNINNLSLKQSLFESSNSLCAALKVYMIRLKSCSDPNKNLILDAIKSVFECANQFKSIILKYYFKSF